MATNPPSETAQAQATATSAGAGDEPTFQSLGIKNSTINEASGVQLSARQKLMVGSILDLFEGNPTLKHFTLWSPTATFADPITKAVGEAKYKAQWYGLPALFYPIRLQSHRVTSGGGPIELELSNKYVVRGIGREHVINSVVNIFVDGDGRIERVEDKWNGKLPEGVIADTFRKLNAVTIPMFVTVPKTEEEDIKMKAARELQGEKKTT